MSVLAPLIGVILILAALRDVFQQLFRPNGAGSLARPLMRLVWSAFGRIVGYRPGLLALAGPCAYLVVILSWVVLVAVGWALVYWPYLPEQFLLSTGLDPSDQDGFVDALYVSLMTLTTVGYGDIAPKSGWLRMVGTLQALVGFGLLTAAISYLLSIYPALSRRRTFAFEVYLIRESEPETGNVVEKMSPDAAERMLADLASRVVTVRNDLVQFPITYYFHGTDGRSALPAGMPYLLYLAQKAAGPDLPPEVRFRAAILHGAIEGFSATVGTSFLGLPSSAPASRVFEAYAHDHLREPRE